METYGFALNGNKEPVPAKRDAEDDVPAQLKRHDDDWRAVFLECVADNNLSLRTSTSKSLRALATPRAPLIEPLFPQSYRWTRDWLLKSAQKHNSLAIQSRTTAVNSITLNFDAWKSDNEIDLLVIVAQYLDSTFQANDGTASAT